MKKSKFMTQILIFFSLVIIIGICTTAILVSRSMASKQIELQSKYEEQILTKKCSDLNKRLNSIGNIMTQIYLKNYDASSIGTLLEEGASQEYLEEVVEKFINSSCTGNPYVNDILFVDYVHKKVYFSSKKLFQTLDDTYDFFSSDLLKKIKKQKNEIVLTDEYRQNYYKEKESVISIYLNIMDTNNLNLDKKYGSVIVNIKPEDLFESNDSYDEGRIGSFFVVNKDNRICYASDTAAVGMNFYDYYQVKDKDEFVNLSKYTVNKAKALSWSGLTYFNVVDKEALYKNTYYKMLRQIFPIIMMLLIVCFVMNYIVAEILGKRISRMANYMKKIQEGDMDGKIEVNRQDEIAVLENGLNDMSGKLKEYIETIYINDIKMKKSELRALQIQINPHFMFNTLESIRAMAVSNENLKAAQMLSVLGNMFRWNLKNKDVVKLEEEMEYVDYYIQLQEVRFGNRLEYSEKVKPKHLNVNIPKLTLQPLIENAINHAFDQSMRECMIEIRSREEDEKVCIEVVDNGSGMSEEQMIYIEKFINNTTEEENMYHIGLKNVNQRLKLLLGDSYGIKFHRNVTEGTVVEIWLPTK